MDSNRRIGDHESHKLKELGVAVREVESVFDEPTPQMENADPMARPFPRELERLMRSPDLRPQNSCERSRSEDKRQSGLTPTPFVSQLALSTLPDEAIASTYQSELELFTNITRNAQAADGTKTPAAARPLLRRSTSDALRASQQKLRQLQSSAESIERPATPGLVSPTPVRRSRSSTYTTFCNDEREPQHDKSSLYLPHPSREPQPNPNHSPSFLDNIRRRQPMRPPAPHRTPSHEVQQRERALHAELESLRGQLSNHEQRREREMVAVNFALNRIIEQQNNQMHVQQMLLEKLAGMDLQATQGIQQYAAAHDQTTEQAKAELQVEAQARREKEASLEDTAAEEASEFGTVSEAGSRDEQMTPEHAAEVDREWKARLTEG